MTVRKVLFLCTGNSCRSQMAEAIVNSRYPDWHAFSAGSRPAGVVHPMAIRVLREIGIEHRGVSKSVDRFRNDIFDRVVTLCDEANEECPAWLGSGQRLHENFPDPMGTPGTEEQRIRAFRQVRDGLLKKIPAFLA